MSEAQEIPADSTLDFPADSGAESDAELPTGKPDPAAVPEPATPGRSDTHDRAREIGGREGPDPTRYGDWEKNGRCIDF